MRIVIICIGFLFFYGNISAQSATTSKIYEIWDDKPAPNSGGDMDSITMGGVPFDNDWEKQSYPIGNGYMGASIFGRTDTERIQITEKTLCNDGLYGLGGLTNFAEIFLDINHQNPDNYRRSLNLNKAVSSVSYTYQGVDYKRDYFVSYPNNVLVVKLSANKSGKISFTLRPEIPYLSNEENNSRSGNVVAKDNLITLSGKLSPFNMNYEAQIKVINNGGDLSVINKDSKDRIVVSNANSVVLLIATGTNYKLSQHIFNEQVQNKKLDATVTPHKKVSRIIAKASNKSFDELLKVHLNDYQKLFSRVDINFESKVHEIPTHEQLQKYKEEEGANKYLEELMFQYGRYLLIASSRKGGLPSGLQGVWSQYRVTPWTGGYWHNINVQMNYWGAFNANLAETFLPYIDYYNAYLPQAKKNAVDYIKKHNPEVLSEKVGGNGWTIGTAAGPFKISGPGSHSGPGTGGFTTKLFWDYYDFTRDSTFLRTTGYPAILGMSKFLSKTVKPSKEGLLLVEPSASPEQRNNGNYYTTIGTTFDQGFITENHNDLIKASIALGINNAFLDLVKHQLTKLDPILIGASGQIKEYREEVSYGDIGDKHHRHISHLCPLYPGTLINSTTPEWIKASIVTLDLRGNRTTGWAMAHRMNVRARTKDGDKAYEVYKKLIQEKTLDNLWTTHPPFQIDANLGSMAGVAEMLLQSHEGYIEPLPALPSEWMNGQYRGLVARGNFEISVEWKNGKASRIEVFSISGGECKLLYPFIEDMKLTDSQGNNIPCEILQSDLISFETKKGVRYIFVN